MNESSYQDVDDRLELLTLSHFMTSAKTESFNGVLASELLRLCADEKSLRQAFKRLILNGRIDCLFCSHDPNPHIKRHHAQPKERQAALCEIEALDSFCAYPTVSLLQSTVPPAALSQRPYSRLLMLGMPQLEPVAFDMGALERYCSDPRYKVGFNDYMGNMSIRDNYYFSDQTEASDKTSIQSFGIGFTNSDRPVLIVFLRYLANLTDEHQQSWNSYRVSTPAKMCKQYYQSCIMGEFWQNQSVRRALTKEIRIINEITESIWGKRLFRQYFDDETPIDLTAFLRPTNKNYLRFVGALDKLLSENIDVGFFDGVIDREREVPRKDGKIVVSQKGSLALLNEWLSVNGSWNDSTYLDEYVMGPLKDVRKLRQKPAHSLITDHYSEEFYTDRKELLQRVYGSLSSIRRALMTFPNATCSKIPDWLQNAEIDIF